MAYLSKPVGMIRHDELLNALIALWKIRCAALHNANNAAQIYEQGFEAGLDAVAQVVGLSEHLDAVKAENRQHHQAAVTIIREQRQLSTGKPDD